jgi:hypothetical protein
LTASSELWWGKERTCLRLESAASKKRNSASTVTVTTPLELLNLCAAFSNSAAVATTTEPSVPKFTVGASVTLGSKVGRGVGSKNVGEGVGTVESEGETVGATDGLWE